MLQRIYLCKFELKQTYAFASVAFSRWHSRMKMGKCLQPTGNTHVAKDSRVVEPWNIV